MPEPHRPMRSPSSPILGALAALAAAGCLDEIETPGDREVMCEVQMDCETEAGEVCDEGVCWGDPPESPRFAAVLIPPEDRPDLGTTEIAELSVGADGTTHGLELGASVEIRGRVTLACEGLDSELGCGAESSIPARIHAARPSSIPGAPGFSRTVTADEGVAAGEEAFSLRLPRSAPEDPPYQVTIRPDGSETEMQAEPPLEAVAPPLRTEIRAEEDRPDTVWVLGDPEEHVELFGRVVDAAGRGIADRRVYAIGEWPNAKEAERISTTATTNSEGAFRLRVPARVEGTVDIVARPPSGEVAPRLRATGIELPELGSPDLLEPIELADLVMPSYPSSTSFALPVEGADSGGGKVPVEGAKVSVETVLESEAGIEATFSATASTDDEGVAEFSLIPAGEENRPYAARIHAPSGSRHASSSSFEIAVGPGSGDATSFLASVSLPQRVLVEGEVVDAQGTPIEGAQVDAQASTELSWMLEPESRARVGEHPLPTATTDENGQFVLWLDPLLADRAALYDLAVTPPARAMAPRWSLEGLALGDDADSLALGAIELPEASHARGVVTASEEIVPGAELWLYELGSNATLCDAEHAPGGDDCEPPAIGRGVWQTGDDGSVQLVLPSPD